MPAALMVSAVCGFCGVVAGAFGAHALEGMLSPRLLEVYQTGIHYHLLHAMVMTAISAAIVLSENKNALLFAMFRLSVWLFFVGILLFSGSLYLIAILDLRALGMLTPIGGLFFLGGWMTLFIAGLRARHWR